MLIIVAEDLRTITPFRGAVAELRSRPTEASGPLGVPGGKRFSGSCACSIPLVGIARNSFSCSDIRSISGAGVSLLLVVVRQFLFVVHPPLTTFRIRNLRHPIFIAIAESLL